MPIKQKIGTSILRLEGGCCTEGAERLKREVARMKGILDVDCNYVNGKITVKYDANMLSREEISKAVRNSGSKQTASRSS